MPRAGSGVAQDAGAATTKERRVNVKTVRILTEVGGAFATDIHCTGQIVAVWLDTGTLDTPDLTLTDLNTAEVILADLALAADKCWMPRRLVQTAADGNDIAATYDAPVVMGTLHVAVAGAGDNKEGVLKVAYRG